MTVWYHQVETEKALHPENKIHIYPSCEAKDKGSLEFLAWCRCTNEDPTNLLQGLFDLLLNAVLEADIRDTNIPRSKNYFLQARMMIVFPLPV